MSRQGFYGCYCFLCLVYLRGYLLWSRDFLGWRDSFWENVKERNQISFENEEHFDQSLKSAFLSTPLLWVKLYINEGSMPLIDFVNWLWSEGKFFVAPLFWLCLMAAAVYGRELWCTITFDPFYNILILFAYEKKIFKHWAPN